jgi:ABC-2 type transport system permease protein
VIAVGQFAGMMWAVMLRLAANPTALALMLVMPIVLITVTSQAFEFVLGGQDIEVTVVDLDGSPRSSELIEAIEAQAGLDVRVQEEDTFGESDADAIFAGRDQVAALVIPAGYGERGLTEGEPLVLYVDPIQASVAEVVRDRVRFALLLDELPARIASGLASGVAQDEVRVVVFGAADEPAVQVETSFGEQAQSFPSAFEQSVPGFAVMFGFWLAAFTALFLYYEKEIWQTWLRNVAAPVSRPVILSARIAGYVVMGVVQFIIMFAVGRWVWDVDLGESPAALGLVMLTMSLVAASFGLMVNAWLEGRLAQQQTINLSVIVLAAIGGALVPVFLLPDWMAAIAPATPHYWAVTGFQDVMVRGGGVADALPNASVLVAFSAAFFSIALLRFRFVD